MESTLDRITKIIYQEPQIEKIDPKIECQITSPSAYVATATESDGVKIDGLLPPNFF